MANLIWVVCAQYLGEYRILLTFNDGAVRVFDGRALVTKPLYKSIQSCDAFRQFTLDEWTLSWSNGKIDIAPEYLYEHSTVA